MSSDQDTFYMRKALHEAKKGVGRTSPNPCVGAVIVKNGEIIAKGYHKKAGTPHAEIHALNAAGDHARGATMYVTLEPCNHTGKTPPCSHAVAAAGVKRVVVGMKDPNPLVAGSGITYLQDRGVEVVSGYLEQQCREINRPFLKYITTGLPLMIMKAGISLDGKLNYEKGKPGWITGSESVRKVHKLRDMVDAIMVGGNTALIDNPSLTTRLSRGKGNDPIRVVLDRQLNLPHSLKMFSQKAGAYSWVFCGKEADHAKADRLRRAGVKVTRVNGSGRGLDLKEICLLLGREHITSVLVEGGAALHGAMLQEKLFDYAYIFQAPLFAGDSGISLVSGYTADSRENAVSLAGGRYRRLGADLLLEGELRYPEHFMKNQAQLTYTA